MNKINNNHHLTAKFFLTKPRKIYKVNLDEEESNSKEVIVDKDEKILNLEKSLSEKEKELEKTKRDLNKFYKLYLEHKNKKNRRN